MHVTSRIISQYVHQVYSVLGNKPVLTLLLCTLLRFSSVVLTGTEKLITRARQNGHHEQHVRRLLDEKPGKVYHFEGLEELIEENDPDPVELDQYIANDTPTVVIVNAEELVRVARCKICFENQSNVFFRSCGHVVCCSLCARELKFCPVCRSPIVAKRLVYY